MHSTADSSSAETLSVDMIGSNSSKMSVGGSTPFAVQHPSTARVHHRQVKPLSVYLGTCPEGARGPLNVGPGIATSSASIANSVSGHQPKGAKPRVATPPAAAQPNSRTHISENQPAARYSVLGLVAVDQRHLQGLHAAAVRTLHRKTE